MHAYVSLEHRFTRFHGKIYDKTVYDYGFWLPYLDVFEHVTIVARTADVLSIDDSYLPVNGDRISFREIPNYSGSPRSLLLYHPLKMEAKEIAKAADVLIIRAPCNFGLLLSKYAHQLGRAYGVEVVGDLWDAASCHPLALKVLNRCCFVPMIQRQCREAAVASYVTKSYLQRRFRPGIHTIESVWSDNRMRKADLIPHPKTYKIPKPLRMVYTANFTEYKGHRYLIDTMRHAVSLGVDCRLTLIGGGSGKADVERAVRRYGLENRVIFAGQVGNAEVIRHLDSNDLYISTSMQEGLPRAIVEAAGRGLPVIGFRIGGIPELVPDNYLVAPKDTYRLAGLVKALSIAPNELSAMSSNSLEVAAGYLTEFQSIARRRSYVTLRTIVEQYGEHHAELSTASDSPR